jgi:hypothetical protein
MYDESTISRSYLAVKKTYSMESITWSTHWHAKIIRWDHYNLLNQRKLQRIPTMARKLRNFRFDIIVEKIFNVKERFNI